MSTPTITRRSVLTTDDAGDNVLKAPTRGDILRKVRDLHPQGHRIDDIAAAEFAVTEAARILENATRQYQARLDRLNQLRSRQNLAALTGQPLPQVADTEETYVGRVTRRDPLTANNKTAGSLLLTTGEEVRWTAAASYVDALDVLFDGVPILVTGPVLANGCLSIQSAQPAPRPFWGDGEDYDTYAEVGGMTVMAAGLLKKELRRAHGNDCHDCGQTISKRVHASVADRAAGPVLVCRPCKQQWVDAGRPDAGPIR